VIKLRKALGDNAREPRFILTVPKQGYQLIAAVTHPVPEADPPVLAPSHVAPQRQVTVAAGHPGLWRLALVVLASALVIGLAGLFLRATSPLPGDDTSGIPSLQDGREPPSIIVLPFENLGEVHQNDRFADGITEDIITDLSGVSDLLVIASNTSFTFKGKRISAARPSI
jgi:hypothetical protein